MDELKALRSTVEYVPCVRRHVTRREQRFCARSIGCDDIFDIELVITTQAAQQTEKDVPLIFQFADAFCIRISFSSFYGYELRAKRYEATQSFLGDFKPSGIRRRIKSVLIYHEVS